MPSDPPLLAFSDQDYSLLVQALCRDLLAAGMNPAISVADEMMIFFYYSQGRQVEKAAALYFESGRRIWSTVRQVLRWRFGSVDWGGPLLDFASGYGRVTRHAVLERPPASVWVADISADAVAFQEQQFGVHGLVSSADPERLRCDERFDAIVVSSLFTHLPEPRFRAWLQRLVSLLSPRGLLLFSVHDMALCPPPGPAPRSGYAFEAKSESGSLDRDEYGSSWVTEDFVRSSLREVIGTGAVHRVPRGLASYQDLYLVLPGSGEGEDPFSTLALAREVDGFLEHCSLAGRRQLRLSGWLADRVLGSPPREVSMRIDGRLVMVCRELEPRPDLAQAFPDDPVEAVAWRAILDLPEGADPDSARLEIRALSAAGEELGFHAGSILATALRSVQLDAATVYREIREQAAAHAAELDDLRAAHQEELRRQAEGYQHRLNLGAVEADALRHRLAAMEASRFWKLRNLWFAGKRALGLTTER